MEMTVIDHANDRALLTGDYSGKEITESDCFPSSIPNMFALPLFNYVKLCLTIPK